MPLPEIWDKMAETMRITIWRPNPTVKYVGENKNIKFSPTF